VFTYYQPHKLILGERNLWENVVVLAAVTGACFCAAALRFAKRDIPG
jgi:ABC-type transport system involved in multi-copper enzyme maturation permease subunit